jgi:hypothetical protein
MKNRLHHTQDAAIAAPEFSIHLHGSRCALVRYFEAESRTFWGTKAQLTRHFEAPEGHPKGFAVAWQTFSAAVLRCLSSCLSGIRQSVINYAIRSRTV